jgi:hypothetical protein
MDALSYILPIHTKSFECKFPFALIRLLLAALRAAASIVSNQSAIISKTSFARNKSVQVQK